MKEIVFASNNPHKLKEIREMLKEDYLIRSLKDVQYLHDIEESAATLEGNSLIKAQAVFDHCGLNVFADDTGLEVYSLNMEPGVLSARYAGEEKDNLKNMAKLLKELKNKPDRRARFRTVITLIQNGEIRQFEGEVKGLIAKDSEGTEGFGYDPIFIPEGHERTFAQMSSVEKNKLSHRARAVGALVNYLTRNVH